MSLIIVQNIYYALAFIAFLWMARRYRSSAFLLLMLCMGFEGTLTYWVQGLIPQYMRMIYTLWITYLVFKLDAWSVIKGKMLVLLWTFVVFSAYFIWDALYMNDDPFLMTFSQYSMYYVPFAALLVFGYYHHRNPTNTVYFNKFFTEFILIQIISGVVKFILLPGHMLEGMVGTFGGIGGGGAGTSFPLVALAWVLVNSNMEIKGWKSWLFVAGLMMVGIATGKRAIIFLFPVFFLILAMYVARKRYKRGVVISTILIVPLFFYFGLRLTPSLNPEKKFWGSFDPEYALNYAEDYSMGVENKQGDRGEGNGRIGANVLIWQQIYDNYTTESWFGHGLDRIYAYKKGTYSNRRYNFGINHRGSMTGFVMMYLSTGLIGLLLFIIYYWTYFIPVKYWRLRFSLYVMVMFDFIFYNAQCIREPIMQLILIFIMYYSQIQYTPRGKFVGQKHEIFM